ncbi:MAG: type I-C CRISPR-associated protein Cas8c/Csd1 [Synergistaceae bacterium]|jgi:CRISPR-associated protein Csd1|nr:type I-C CRISPR-associated protein Cas8c/Csd1 [Synergistaceae bacterium]
MSWIQKLYETYERANAGRASSDEAAPLPVSHVAQQAHIQITLGGSGRFRRADFVMKEDNETLVPATENSAGRTGINPASHPLCDKIQYVAKDYLAYGGEKSFFEEYRSLLFRWNQAYPHEKLSAILNYVDEGHVIADLVEADILLLDENGKLSSSCPDSRNKPQIFTLVKDQAKAFVRWEVQTKDPESRTWKDKALMDSWARFAPTLLQKRGLCLITGEDTLLGTNHAKGIRYAGDNAKLISSNDTKGFTYRGRFTDSEQACSVGYSTSQKAHNALKWLIRRQSFRNGDQVIVAWEVAGRPVPSPVQNSYEFLKGGDDSLKNDGGFMKEGDSFENHLESASETVQASRIDQGDQGQLFARRLSAKIAGYRRELGSSKDIAVMALDSATPGRMAITYYRELTGSEFLERLEAWHRDFAWFQNYPKNLRFFGAPAPKEIAEAAFGKRLNDKLSKATVERILPCIVDGVLFPRDLVQSTRNRAVNRMGMEHWEWEKVLGIACALFYGANKGGYRMALETERTSRDYLFGRLLAVAERLEYIALNLAGENRDTNAAKLMQRFSERPYSTWLQIERNLVPYKTRLQSRRAAFLSNMTGLLDDIHNLFQPDDYMKDTPLGGEFLLAYHCQRHELRKKTKDGTDQNTPDTDEEELENVSHEQN